MENTSLSLEQVNKWYAGGVHAVKDINMEVRPGEFLVFVGPSGCGKSTTLRMIAGLERVDSGIISIGGIPINRVPPKNRDIAMVFQNYALYPTMKVFDNIAFPLKMRYWKRDEIRHRVNEIAENLDLTKYLQRRPGALSGGQRQRVALAHAMVRSPKLFLMNEPLSNLDAKLRVQMRREITALQQKLGTTTIYVTYDQTEAMTMGHRIAIFKDGILQQIDTPQALYQKPANLFVAQFIGSPPMNVWSEGNQILGIRPEHIHITDHPDHISAEVTSVERTGRETMVFVKAQPFGKLVAATDASCMLEPGDVCRLMLDKQFIHYFDAESEDRIDREPKGL